MNPHSESNPAGLDGVECIEYGGSDRHHFEALFKQFGFEEIAQAHGKNMKLFRQGDIHFVLNCEPHTFASEFSQKHGPCISSTGLRVFNAAEAFAVAVANGAIPYEGNKKQQESSPFPAIYGIGDSLIYFIDPANRKILYEDIFDVPAQKEKVLGFGFQRVDYFTHGVPSGEMQKWCEFYTKIFNFKETIATPCSKVTTSLSSKVTTSLSSKVITSLSSKVTTSLSSKVLQSPCGKFSVRVSEPVEEKSPIQKYLDEYRGAGIQHLALLTNDIIETVKNLKAQGVHFLSPPSPPYYEEISRQIPGIQENLGELESNALLVEGNAQGYLLHLFTNNVIGPIFYEVIQRKGYMGVASTPMNQNEV